MRFLERNEQKSPSKLTDISDDTGIPVSSLSSTFKTLTHIKVINKASGGFEIGENAQKYMLKWLGAAYELDS